MRAHQVKSKRGAVRLYNAILRQCYLDMRGGTQYGIDWPTLRSTWPDRYAEIQQLRAMWPTLPA